MTQFVHLKLSQIQYDMISFGISKKEIKTLMNKYLKQSKIIPKTVSQEIMMKLQLAEKRHSQLLEKKLVVSDELFNDNYQSVVNRDQRSTLFGITTKNALFEKLHHERPRQSSTVKENFKLSGIQEEDEPLEPESPNLMKQNILSVTLND